MVFHGCRSPSRLLHAYKIRMSKSTQIAKRVLAEHLVLERGHLPHQDLEHKHRVRDQNAAMDCAEERVSVKLGYDQDDWFLTNLYDWVWKTTDEDLRIIDSTENEWMDWWQAWCRGDHVSF